MVESQTPYLRVWGSNPDQGRLISKLKKNYFHPNFPLLSYLNSHHRTYHLTGKSLPTIDLVFQTQVKIPVLKKVLVSMINHSHDEIIALSSISARNYFHWLLYFVQTEYPLFNSGDRQNL